MPSRSSKKPPKKTPPPSSAPEVASSNRPKRPRDSSQLAWMVVAEATGMEMTPPIKEAVAKAPEREKNPHAVALGRLGGAKGGKARAEKLSKAKRRAIAKRGAAARWGKTK